MDREALLSELEDAKQLQNPPLSPPDTEDDSDEEVDKKIHEIFKIVKSMDISADTSDNELTKCSHVQ